MTEIEMQDRIEQQEALIQVLAMDPAFDIMTRSGLEQLAWPKVAAEATHVIFADIDDMHALNERHGWDEVSRRIKNSLHSRTVESRRKMDVGRWFSGDEVLWVICEGDPMGLANSVLQAMKVNGLSATFGIAPVTSPLLWVNVAIAKELVARAKAEGRRGTINS